MNWQLEVGKHLPHLLKLQEKGRKVKLLDDQPILTEESSYYLKAFQDLNLCRASAQGDEPISVQDIWFYCKLNSITDVEQRQQIFEMIKHIDSLFITWNRKKASSK